MRRKVSAVIASCLTLISGAWAQTYSANTPATSRIKPHSPYHVTASTLDGNGEPFEPPQELPAIVVPHLPIGRLTSLQPPPPVTPPTPAPAPAAPTGPANTPNVAISPPSTAPVIDAEWGQPNGIECCNSGCDPCGPQGRMWGGVEYLLWTTSGMNVPALVTASPRGSPLNAAGVLGDPRTAVLFGGGNINDDFRSGIRAYSGMWLDECQTCGIESSIIYLEPGNDGAAFVGSNNQGIIARPFLDVNPANIRSNAVVVAFPNALTGSTFVSTQSTFWATDVNVRKNLCCGCDYRLDVLGGYRYAQLQDRVVVSDQVATLFDFSGATVTMSDRFSSRNTFNGGQIGLSGEVRRGRFFVGTRGLVALGGVHKEVEIAGATTISIPGQFQQTVFGGLLAQPSNVGKVTLNEFAVMPEATVSLGYHVTDGIRAYVGYSFLYLSNVSRAGNQIDPLVNSTQFIPGQLIGPSRPVFIRSDSDFWAQGINFGLEVRF
jgi:Putative beta barrel porin-7 (BBP7)